MEKMSTKKAKNFWNQKFSERGRENSLFSYTGKQRAEGERQKPRGVWGVERSDRAHKALCVRERLNEVKESGATLWANRKDSEVTYSK